MARPFGSFQRPQSSAVVALGQIRGPSNNGLHQTGARRSGPFRSSSGQSLRRAPAGEAGCSTGLGKSGRLEAMPPRDRWLRAGLICIAVGLASCHGSSCEPKERGSATSADGLLKAVELFHDCGNATVGFYTEVVVQPPKAKWPFDELRVLLIKGDVSVVLEWRIGRVLKLTVPRDANVQQFRARIDDLPIILERQ